ncbi:MAG: YdbL family protein [Pseudomonadota bacterium]
MKPIRLLSLVLVAAFFVAACVTINVYFPEAAAEEAADRFIEDVIGSEGSEDASDATDGRGALRLNPLDWFFPAAHAQVDIDINTPAIRAIQARMESRFQQDLVGFFSSGAVGFTNDALVAIRDPASLPLADRNRVRALVKAENDDRNAVYREIAVANGHPEWEGQIRSTFAERWIANARSGWYYQDSGGSWRQK